MNDSPMQPLQPPLDTPQPIVTETARSLAASLSSLEARITLQRARFNALRSDRATHWTVFEADRLKIAAGKFENELQCPLKEHVARMEKTKSELREAEDKLALLFVQRWQLNEKLRDEQVMAKAYQDLVTEGKL